MRRIFSAAIAGAALMLLIASSHSPLRAASIVYTWAGTIERTEGRADPWEIGPAGKPFLAKLYVDDSAAALSGLQTWAFFDLVSARAWIDGERAMLWNSGGLNMIENWGSYGDPPGFDHIETFSDLLFRGHAQLLYLGVGLPHQTFSLIEPDTPPVFDNVIIDKAIKAWHGDFDYHFSLNHPVSISASFVPEALNLPASAMLMLAFYRRNFLRTASRKRNAALRGSAACSNSDPGQTVA